MAIRPVDLQQTFIRTPDVSHDAATQQQGALAQQAHSAESTRRQAERAETVQQFDEAGAVLIRERQGRAGQQQEQGQEDEDGADASLDPQQNAGAGGHGETTSGRLGRHIDLSA